MTVKRHKASRYSIGSTGNRFLKTTDSNTQSQTKLSIFQISLSPCVASSNDKLLMSGVFGKLQFCAKSGQARKKMLGFVKYSTRAFIQLPVVILLLDYQKLLYVSKRRTIL